MSALPRPVPQITHETAAFWQAAAEGKLLLRHCQVCQSYIWYPRALCPFCHSAHDDWIEASGRGRVYTFAIVRKGSGFYSQAAPYVLAYVELDEGPRILTNVVDCDPACLEVGQAVEAVFHRASETAALVRFRPVSD